MFFSGLLTASPTLANFQADLIGILTGAINSPAGLSSNFSSGSFINTVAPGWEVTDAAAGTTANGVTPKVIRAPWSDDGTKFKNVLISSSSTTQLGFLGYHTWNSIAHTGTFPTNTNAAAGTWLSLPLVANQQITISASPTHLLITTGPISAQLTAQVAIFEYTRDDLWNTVANGYPSWLQCGQHNLTAGYGSHTPSTTNAAIPFGYNLSIAADVAPAYGTNPGVPGSQLPGHVFLPAGLACLPTIFNYGGGNLNGAYAPALDSTQGPSATKAASKFVFDITYRQASNVNSWTSSIWLGGNISKKCPFVFHTHNNLGAPGDDMVIGADTYWVTRLSNFGRFLIKKA